MPDMSSDDVAKMFENEVRDKKRIAGGARGMASRGKGFKGAVWFPYEIMDKKEKREYTKGGKIMKYNQYESIEDVPSLEEINKLEIDEGHKVIDILRNRFSVKELKEYWGCTTYEIYGRLFNKYGIKTRPVKSRKDKKRGSDELINTNVVNVDDSAVVGINGKKEISDSEMKQLLTLGKMAHESFEIKKKEEDFDGFSIRLNGEYRGKVVEDRILGMMATLDKGSKYKIVVRIDEIESVIDEEIKEEIKYEVVD